MLILCLRGQINVVRAKTKYKVREIVGVDLFIYIYTDLFVVLNIILEKHFSVIL